ncbi:MAG: Inosine-5'-monophosphate dehydrogenase [Candidatus Heimdallarchaeota archaeon LC_3]|nr:MAG: Inosine-5'-monophosphate dehydrogenase [Candidatus Heimdallarchaeota archaeon LC_3]
MIVGELRSKSVKDVIVIKTSITVTGTISEAVEKMSKDKTGVIAILEPETNKFLGLFTKRHLLRRVILQNREKNELVSSVFTPNPISILDNSNLEEAFVIMYKHNYKYLPVVNEFNEFFGFIVAEDLLRFLEDQFPETISTAQSKKSFTTRDGA